tara:strand:+ start:34 stop:771 length:738 start_codon:yes stop_codon:yes gene_type:complete
MKEQTIRSNDGEITVNMLPKFLHEVKFKYNPFLEKHYGWMSRNQIPRDERNETEHYFQVGLAMHEYLRNVIDKLSRRRLQNHPVTLGNSFKSASEEAQKEAKEKAHQILSRGIVDQLEEVWGTECAVCLDEGERRIIDLVGIHKNKLSIIDFKSSQHIFVEREQSKDQVINYAFLHNLYSERKVEKCIVMICDKDGYREIIVNEKELNFSYKEISKYLTAQKKSIEKDLNNIEYKISNLIKHERN